MNDSQLLERMRASVMQGDAGRARALAREAMDAGWDPLAVLDEGFTSALRAWATAGSAARSTSRR